MVSKNKIESDILKIIKTNNLFYVVDIFAFYTKLSRATFYGRGFDKMDTIKEALDNNKIIQRQKLKARWVEEDAAPVLQIAVFKTICSVDDLRKLSQSYNDHSSEDGTMSPKIIVNFNDDEISLEDE